MNYLLLAVVTEQSTDDCFPNCLLALWLLGGYSLYSRTGNSFIHSFKGKSVQSVQTCFIPALPSQIQMVLSFKMSSITWSWLAYKSL